MSVPFGTARLPAERVAFVGVADAVNPGWAGSWTNVHELKSVIAAPAIVAIKRCKANAIGRQTDFIGLARLKFGADGSGRRIAGRASSFEKIFNRTDLKSKIRDFKPFVFCG